MGATMTDTKTLGYCDLCGEHTVDLDDPFEYREDEAGLYHEDCAYAYHTLEKQTWGACGDWSKDYLRKQLREIIATWGD